MYENSYTVHRGTDAASASSERSTRTLISVIVGILAFILFFVAERNFYLIAGCVDEAEETARGLSRGPFSDPSLDGQLIFTTTDPASPPALAGVSPRDDMFPSVEPPRHSAVVRRVTEYCQVR